MISTKEPLLKVENLCKHFGGVHAAEVVNLGVITSEIHGLIGPNGSGKTTVFNCLTGVYKPTSGKVRFGTSFIDGLAPHTITKAGIARTFQNLRLFSGMTVLENVLVGSHLHQKAQVLDALFRGKDTSAEESTTLAESRRLVDFCGLTGRENEIARSLPYGLQRRLEIARALATKPTLLLLDEPAAGMNHAEADNLRKLILAIRDLGVTILLIEHNVRLVMGLCDRVTVMDSGMVIADDIPEAILRNPKVIEAYLGVGTL